MSNLLLLSCIILFTSFWLPYVNGSAVQTLIQYSECKNLKMIKLIDPNKNIRYVPDSKIPNNTLTDAYYQKFLANLTWDKAMNLLAGIYAERSSKNCTSEFCNCSRTSYDDFNSDYGGLLRKKEMIDHVKRIVQNFINKFNYTVAKDYQQGLESYIMRTNLPTVINFTMNYEFCLARLFAYNASFYRTEFPGFRTQLPIQEIYESCYWERILTNKTYVYNPNATQQEQFMICETLGVLNTSLEYQQFYTMNIWALRFAMVTWAKTQTFTDFLNKIIQNARSFRPKNQYYALNLVLSRQNIILICQRRNIILGVLTNSSNITLNLINSPWLKIDVQRLAFLSANDSKVVEISKIGWLNFTFYVNGLSQSAVSLNININSLSSIKNGTVGLDKNKARIYEIVIIGTRIHIFDYNTNSRFVFTQLAIDASFFIQQRYVNTASGFLTTGLTPAPVTPSGAKNKTAA